MKELFKFIMDIIPITEKPKKNIHLKYFKINLNPLNHSV
jgi:hypothetical protein